MLRLASFEPGLFNVNGDQANLEVLAAEIAWAGHRAEVSALGDDAVSPDLVLFGSAARKTMRVLEPQLWRLLPALRERQRLAKPTVFIGSSYERFAREIFGLEPNPIERRSDYFNSTFEAQPLRGYLNSAVDLPALVIESEQIGSSLSGPLFAKNRWLLERTARLLGIQLQTPKEILELQRMVAGQ
jgi:hypothetical protein